MPNLRIKHKYHMNSNHPLNLDDSNISYGTLKKSPHAIYSKFEGHVGISIMDIV